MFFEYPYLLWLLAVPALLVLRYLWIEWKDRRAHMRVSALDAWKAGGRSVFEILRHVPFVLRIAALCLLVVAIARPRSSSLATTSATQTLPSSILVSPLPYQNIRWWQEYMTS